VVALGRVLVWLLLAWGPSAFALEPSLDISQYAHTAWKVRDGFFKGAVHAIAQTPDGYLWLGTEFGLVRFDGVKAAAWQPPPDQPLPAGSIQVLLTARDGTLWIGTATGLASWKSGKLTQYPELAGQNVFSLLEDRKGSVWAGSFGTPTGKLCAIQNGSVRCYGEDGSLGPGVFTLYEDRQGNLWAGVQDGLWRWKPDNPEFYRLPKDLNGIRPLGEDEDGALLIGLSSGIRRFVDGKLVPYPLPDTIQQAPVTMLLRDRDGDLWIATHNHGLAHLRRGRTDLFTEADGLSGNNVIKLFKDREGNIWAATSSGLDRFRDFAVPTFTAKQGLLDAPVGSILAARDGSLWLGSLRSLSRWHNGQITPFGNQDGKLNGLAPNSLFQDRRGRIWVSTNSGFGYIENDRFIPISAVPGGFVHSIVEDGAGEIWIANRQRGLIRLQGETVEQIPWAALGRKDYAWSVIADPLKGGLWLGFYQGDVAYFADGGVRAWHSAKDGLGAGRVNGFRLDPDGTLWVATDGGLSRLKNSRIATLTSKHGLPCDTVHWVMEDDDHSFWLYTPCGLVRVARSEVDAWAAAVEKDKDTQQRVQVTVLDNPDGVRSRATTGGYVPRVAKTADGRLWFLPQDGVSVIDPRRLPFNQLPPPVHIERITANGLTYDAAQGLRLPPLIRDLAIDFTALSLVAPEKVRFRYMLEGQDPDWKEVAGERRAQYSNLGPGHYRFRVLACNNSGVWNEEGALLDFSIAPAFYQTTWFRLACVALSLALLWAAYQLRVGQLARQFNLTLEARVSERTRIARELHDTLLQSFQGLVLRFQSASKILPARPDEAKQRLDSAVDLAAEAIAEGRDAVQGLRSSASETNDLANGIAAIAGELTSDPAALDSPAIDVEVEGAPRNLNPIVRDEAYRIAGEALRNAFRHAHARRITVEIRYEKRQFRLRVSDDGKGIDEETVRQQLAGHFGLHGMRERAEIVGGRLEVWSRLDSGTQVELHVPGAVAYDVSARRSWLSQVVSGNNRDKRGQ
jgi:signal transduction histidine kinase/ligand-binding sensor domain-containing protein